MKQPLGQQSRPVPSASAGATAVSNKANKLQRTATGTTMTRKPTADVINIVVDNEISFNIGSAVKPKQNLALPKSNVKKVPDFNKMHSQHFSAQKSITQKVARVRY
jgi:hypothetical protein